MMSKFIKVPAALLLASFILMGMIMPVSAQTVPLSITGHVNVNGVATSGVQASCNGASYSTGSDGYYSLGANVANGSHVTVNFNYNGHTASVTVTSNGYAVVAPTANIVYQTATPTPSATVTATPTATPSATVTATPTATPSATASPPPQRHQRPQLPRNQVTAAPQDRIACKLRM